MHDKKLFLKSLNRYGELSVSEKLCKAVVGIAGCGGLGSNVAAVLARAGVGRLIIVDFDKVILSNLGRQFFFVNDIDRFKVDALCDNLKKINPFIEIEKKCIKIDINNIFELFRDVDVIVEAFDEVSEKSMMLNTFLTDIRFKEKYLVCASGVAGLESSNMIQTKKFTERVFIVGDFCSQLSEQGIMANRILVAAGHQANMAVRIILGELNP